MRRREERKRGPYRKTISTIVLYLLKHPYATTRQIIRETKREAHSIIYGLHFLQEKKIIAFKTGKQRRKHWFIASSDLGKLLPFLQTSKKKSALSVVKAQPSRKPVLPEPAKIEVAAAGLDIIKTIAEVNEKVRKHLAVFGEFYEKNSIEIKQLDTYYRRFNVKIGEFEVNSFVKLVQAYLETKKEVDRLMLLNPKDPRPLLMLFEAVKQPGRLPEIKTALRRAVASETVEIVAEPVKCPNCLVNLVQNRFCPRCGLDVLHYEFDLLNRPQPLRPAWRKEG